MLYLPGRIYLWDPGSPWEHQKDTPKPLPSLSPSLSTGTAWPALSCHLTAVSRGATEKNSVS